MEQSGRNRRQMTADGDAAKPAQPLANRLLPLHPLADDPRW